MRKITQFHSSSSNYCLINTITDSKYNGKSSGIKSKLPASQIEEGQVGIVGYLTPLFAMKFVQWQKQTPLGQVLANFRMVIAPLVTRRNTNEPIMRSGIPD